MCLIVDWLIINSSDNEDSEDSNYDDDESAEFDLFDLFNIFGAFRGFRWKLWKSRMKAKKHSRVFDSDLPFETFHSLTLWKVWFLHFSKADVLLTYTTSKRSQLHSLKKLVNRLCQAVSFFPEVHLIWFHAEKNL